MITIVFETHSTSEDNELGLASGWAHSSLSATGREQAGRLGKRRATDGITAVFTSDLQRAVETATIAFEGSDIPIFLDWRLRECDYGDMTRAPRATVHSTRAAHVDDPYPGGESWRQAVNRAGRFLDDLPRRWSGQRVLVIGHIATRWALECRVAGVALEALIEAEPTWQAGWEYPPWQAGWE